MINFHSYGVYVIFLDKKHVTSRKVKQTKEVTLHVTPSVWALNNICRFFDARRDSSAFL